MVGRPELYPVKKVIGFDQAMLEAIDHWRPAANADPYGVGCNSRVGAARVSGKAEAASEARSHRVMSPTIPPPSGNRQLSPDSCRTDGVLVTEGIGHRTDVPAARRFFRPDANHLPATRHRVGGCATTATPPNGHSKITTLV